MPSQVSSAVVSSFPSDFILPLKYSNGFGGIAEIGRQLWRSYMNIRQRLVQRGFSHSAPFVFAESAGKRQKRDWSIVMAIKIIILLLAIAAIGVVARQSLHDNQNRSSIEKVTDPKTSPWGAPVGVRPPDDSTRKRQ